MDCLEYCVSLSNLHFFLSFLRKILLPDSLVDIKYQEINNKWLELVQKKIIKMYYWAGKKSLKNEKTAACF